MFSVNILSIAPILCLVGVSLIALAIEALVRNNERISFWVVVLGILFSIVISVVTFGREESFGGMVSGGGYGSFFGILFLISALLTIVLSREYLRKCHRALGEFYLLVLFATLGMMIIASAGDLIMVFLGIELMSVCLYVLAGYLRQHMKANESSLKYFLLGAFATGFLLYGIALVYGSTGSTNIGVIAGKYTDPNLPYIFWIGLGFLLVGLAFKVAAVPFHMWVPDVYEGAPTTISGFMSTGGKAAAFSAFVLVFAHQFVHGQSVKVALAVVAAASMILGNVIAMSQTNIKRMLAYSSIAHAGYMLAGLAAANQLGRIGILFYLTVYMFMNIGAFGVLSLLEEDQDRNLTLGDYAGLGSKRPYMAALMAIYMFSLSGLPPFAGFLGKYFVFAAAVKADLTWLAIVGVLTSIIGVYYYLRLVVLMYFEDGTKEMLGKPSIASMAVLTLAAAALLHFGIFPSSILSFIDKLF